MFQKRMLPPSSGSKFKGQRIGLLAVCKEEGCADTRKEETEMNPLRGSGAAGMATAILRAQSVYLQRRKIEL
jgi:hypothetical protein